MKNNRTGSMVRPLLLVLMIYATIFEPFNHGGINLLLVFLVPFLLVIISVSYRVNLKGLFTQRYLPLWMVFAYILFSAAVNFNSLRWSSLAYTSDLVLCFLLYFYLLEKQVNSKIYIRWLTIVIAAFFAALVIQQVGIWLGFTNFFNKLSTLNYHSERNYIFNLNALSTEPSYAATIVSITFFSLLKIKTAYIGKSYGLGEVRKDGIVWFMYLYQLIFYRSVFGVLFFLIICFYLFNFRTLKTWLILGCLLFIGVTMSSDYMALDRIRTLLENIDIHDIEALAYVDHSGSIRVLPLYYYLIGVDLHNYHSYLGYGLDYSQTYLRALIPGIPEGTAFGGLIPSFPFDFGIIGFLLLSRMLAKFCLTKLVSLELVMIILVMLNATLNTQLFWFVIIVFSINKLIITTQGSSPYPLSSKGTSMSAGHVVINLKGPM